MWVSGSCVACSHPALPLCATALVVPCYTLLPCTCTCMCVYPDCTRPWQLCECMCEARRSSSMCVGWHVGSAGTHGAAVAALSQCVPAEHVGGGVSGLCGSVIMCG